MSFVNSLKNLIFRPKAHDVLEPSGAAIVPFMGSQSSNHRTDTSGMPTDSRREITSHSRAALVKKSRWLYNNMGLIKRFVNGVARYSVGSGIAPIPVTGNEEFDEELDKYFCAWADSKDLCDVRRKLSFWRMQKHVLRATFKDGEAFALKAPLPDEELIPGVKIMGAPRIQWHEQQRVGSVGYANSDRDQYGFIEGIKHDRYGAPLQYRFLEDQQDAFNVQQLTKQRIVKADAVLHIYDPERAEQVRGLPWLYHGINSALDILDLTALEKHAAKLHAAVAAAIKRRSDAGKKKGVTGDLDQQSTAKNPGSTRVIAFENFASGAGILQMALDEEFQLLTSNRPSVVFEGFIDYLVRDIAWGFGVSPEFIWSVSGLGGPNARAILEDAKWFFEEVQDLIVNLFCQPIYMWVIARGIERGELKVPEGADPFSVAWQGPAKITIDQGREGSLELERLRNGCGTWEEYWAARGKTGRKQVRKRIDEIADAMEYAFSKKGPGHEEGVPFDYIMELKKGGNTEPKDEDEETPTKKPKSKAA
jgi:lambda family phage portal protein